LASVAAIPANAIIPDSGALLTTEILCTKETYIRAKETYRRGDLPLKSYVQKKPTCVEKRPIGEAIKLLSINQRQMQSGSCSVIQGSVKVIHSSFEVIQDSFELIRGSLENEQAMQGGQAWHTSGLY